MQACIFYNFFSKTSFLSSFAFCVFCFESNVLNQDKNMCYHHLKRSNCYVILFSSLYKNSRSSHSRRSIKNLLKITHRKVTVLESLFSKVASFLDCNVIKKRLQDRSFFVNIAKFLRTTVLKNICERLLLKLTLTLLLPNCL